MDLSKVRDEEAKRLRTLVQALHIYSQLLDTDDEASYMFLRFSSYLLITKINEVLGSDTIVNTKFKDKFESLCGKYFKDMPKSKSNTVMSLDDLEGV